MNVTSVNNSYIHYSDGKSVKTREAEVYAIMNEAKTEAAFYRRMYQDLDEEYNRLRTNLKFGKPSADRDNYFERVGALTGISDAMKKASDKELRAIQIETQCRLALGIGRRNIAEMYPELNEKR